MNATEEKILEELTWFARECGGERCFPGWTEELIREYLVFHLKQGTCGYVREWETGPRTRRLLALGIGWQLNEREMFRPRPSPSALHGQGEGMEPDPEFVKKPFRWQFTNPRGDSFLFCDLMAIDRKGLPVLTSEFQWRWPNWRRLKLFSIRRGKLVRYDAVEKLLSRMEGL